MWNLLHFTVCVCVCVCVRACVHACVCVHTRVHSCMRAWERECVCVCACVCVCMHACMFFLVDYIKCFLASWKQQHCMTPPYISCCVRLIRQPNCRSVISLWKVLCSHQEDHGLPVTWLSHVRAGRTVFLSLWGLPSHCGHGARRGMALRCPQAGNCCSALCCLWFSALWVCILLLIMLFHNILGYVLQHCMLFVLTAHCAVCVL